MTHPKKGRVGASLSGAGVARRRQGMGEQPFSHDATIAL